MSEAERAEQQRKRLTGAAGVIPALWVRRLPLLLLGAAILLYMAYFTQLTLVRYWAFEARALDLGNFHQAVWNTWQGRPFHLTNQEGVLNRLSLHVEPILIPISGLYWIHSGPETLLILQSVVVALGALPLFAIARLRLSNRWLALTFAVAYLLNPSMQAANWLEFHGVTLAPTFLLAAFYGLLTRRNQQFVLWAVLAAACKEEIALLICTMGLYALVVQRRWRFAGWTVGLSLAWALIAVLGIQDHFAAGNIHWGRYGYLGETPLAMVTTLLMRPDVVLAQLRAANALGYLFQLLLPVAFLALLAPEILLLALPSLAINLLADFPPMHQVDTLIYAAPIVPFVLVAAVFGAGRVKRWALGKSPPAVAPFILPLLAVVVLSGAGVAQWRSGYTPWGANYLPLTVTQHHRNATAILAQIPPEAKVSAQDRLNPHVAGRKTVYIFPRVEDADMIFLDVTGPAWPQHPADLKRTVDELLAGEFGVAAAHDGYLLLSRGETNTELPASFYEAWHVSLPAPGEERTDSSMHVDFGNSLRLREAQIVTDRYGELVVQLVWQVLRPLEQEIGLEIAYRDAELNTLHDTQFYPPVATLWYPTHLWGEGGSSGNGSTGEATEATGADEEGVLVQTLPWTLDADRFVLTLAVHGINPDGSPGPRWPVTATEPPLPVLEGGTLVRLGGYAHTDGAGWSAIPLQPDAPSTPRNVRLGDHIALDGVTAPTQAAAGGSLAFTLHWHTDAQLPIDYTAFVHLLDSTGAKVAQLDWQPHDAVSRLPTSAWLAGQPVVDTQMLALPEELSPGSYQLVAGMYDWRDGARLPTNGPGALPGDVVLVAEFKIE